MRRRKKIKQNFKKRKEPPRKKLKFLLYFLSSVRPALKFKLKKSQDLIELFKSAKFFVSIDQKRKKNKLNFKKRRDLP